MWSTQRVEQILAVIPVRVVTVVSEPALTVSRVGVGHGPGMYTGVCGSVRGRRGCAVSTRRMDVYMC